MGNVGVLDRVTELERRVLRIERRLQLSDALDGRVAAAREAPHANGVDPTPPPPLPPPMPPPMPSAVEAAASEGFPPARLAPSASPQVLPYAPSSPELQAAPVEQGAIEQAIGLKWAGWIGAVVLVIGAGLGINFAWENGWFELFPPAARLLLMSAAAFGLIAAGEVVYRRVSHVSAAGLFGAGVASLYLIAYAGHAYYALYGRDVAFGMMVLATVVGAAVAMRGKLVSIAVLSLIGGNLAPLVLKGEQTLAPLLFYLLMLQLIALALAWWGSRPKWWALRGVAAATLVLWLAQIMSVIDVAARAGLPLLFVPLYAAMFQLELILSARRPRPDGLPHKTLLDNRLGGNVAWSLCVTAALTATLFYLLESATDATRGAWVLSLAAITAALGFALSRRPSHPRYPLAIGFRAQAAALLVLAVPTLLSGPLVTTGWSLLAIAFAYIGMRLDFKLSRWAGVATWLLAIVHLGVWAIHPTSTFNPRETVLTVYNAPLPMYLLSAWTLTWVGHVVAWLTHGYRNRNVPFLKGDIPDEKGDIPVFRLAPRDLAWVTGARAGVVWVAASILALPPLGATLAIVAYAWLLLAADFATPRLGFYLQSAAALAIAVVKWVMIDSLADRLSPSWRPMSQAPIFNATMAMGLVIALSMVGMYFLRRAKWDALCAAPPEDPTVPASRAPLLALALALITLATFAFSLEVDRVVERGAAMGGLLLWPTLQLKHMVWTMLWTVSLAAAVGAVRRMESAANRPRSYHTLAVLMTVLAVKFIAFDGLLFRVGEVSAAPPLANVQTLAAVLVAGGLVGAYALVGAGAKLRGAIGLLLMLTALVAGTLDIDRAFHGTARHVAVSIFWSIFAVAAVVAGFRFRVAGLRYFGLALFALTLMKVVSVDMAEARTGYRVLSFMGLGVLLLGTSVLYGKLSPKLLRAQAA